jgi:FHS family glucose/mannose:H+ symporter-like MFS transporter
MTLLKVIHLESVDIIAHQHRNEARKGNRANTAMPVFAIGQKELKLERVSMPSSAILRRPSSEGQALVVLVHLSFVLTGVVNTLLGPVLPALSARWQLSDAQAGYFFTAQFFGSIAGVILTGLLLPRRGFRFILTSGYLLMAAGLNSLASTEWRFALLGTFVFGFGLGLVNPASNLLVSSTNPGRRAAALSALNFCWGVGAVLAPWAVSIVEARNILWPSLTVFAAGLFLVALAMMAVRSALPMPERQAGSPWRDSGQWRLAAAIAVMFFLYVGTESALGGWLAALMKRLPESRPWLWFRAPSIFWGGLLFGRGVAPWLLRRLRERNLAFMGLTAAATAICVLILARSGSWVLIAAGVAGLGLAAVFPICVALLAHFGEMEQRIGGPMFAFAGLGGAVVPWLVGEVSSASGSLQIGLVLPLVANLILLVLYSLDIPHRLGAAALVAERPFRSLP